MGEKFLFVERRRQRSAIPETLSSSQTQGKNPIFPSHFEVFDYGAFSAVPESVTVFEFSPSLPWVLGAVSCLRYLILVWLSKLLFFPSVYELNLRKSLRFGLKDRILQGCWCLEWWTFVWSLRFGLVSLVLEAFLWKWQRGGFVLAWGGGMNNAFSKQTLADELSNINCTRSRIQSILFGNFWCSISLKNPYSGNSLISVFILALFYLARMKITTVDFLFYVPLLRCILVFDDNWECGLSIIYDAEIKFKRFIDSFFSFGRFDNFHDYCESLL